MRIMQMNIQTLLLFVKIVLLAFILLSPFIQYKSMAFLNNICMKLLMLSVIIALCFVDFQLALTTMIVFIIVIINLNHHMIQTNKNKIVDTFVQPIQIVNDFEPNRSYPVTFHNVYPPNPDTICPVPAKNVISTDIINRFIDSRTKPYEEYVRLSNGEALMSTQGLLYQ